MNKLWIFLLLSRNLIADDCEEKIASLQSYEPKNAAHDAYAAFTNQNFDYLAVMYRSQPWFIGISHEKWDTAVETNTYKIIEDSNGEYCSEIMSLLQNKLGCMSTYTMRISHYILVAYNKYFNFSTCLQVLGLAACAASPLSGR